MKRFWLLSKNIDRLAAEEGMRDLMVLVSAQSEKGHDGYIEAARKTMGNIVIYDEEELAKEVGQEMMRKAEAERDRDGLMALKGMGKISS